MRLVNDKGCHNEQAVVRAQALAKCPKLVTVEAVEALRDDR